MAERRDGGPAVSDGDTRGVVAQTAPLLAEASAAAQRALPCSPEA